MSRLRVKICGLTRQADAEMAAGLGADALGFVFWSGSPRYIEPGAAAEIGRALAPLVCRVGVFVNETPEEVGRVAREARLDAVQLHGDEDLSDYRSLGPRVIKAVTLESDDDVEEVAAWPPGITPLVDAADPIRHGGTGTPANWSRAARLAARRPILLAGGINAATVADAVTHVRPWGVDVSSGVESAPGSKSTQLLHEFFAAVALVNAGRPA